MPYLTEYADDGKGLLKIGRGIVTSAELFSVAVLQSHDEERSRKVRYSLVDFSAVTELKVTPDDVRRVVEMNRKLATLVPPGLPVALVASEILPYAMARLWLTLSDDLGWKATVVRTRKEAVAWLREQLVARAGSVETLEQFPSLVTELDAAPAAHSLPDYVEVEREPQSGDVAPSERQPVTSAL